VWTNEPLDAFDERVLARVEAGLPLVPCPFAALAFELGTAEADIRARLERLRRGGRLHHLGALVVPAEFGWSEMLVALRVAAGAVERAGRIALAEAVVTACDERDDAWNVWVTLAARGPLPALEAAARRLADATSAEAFATLPARHVFKGPDERVAERPAEPLDDVARAALEILDAPLPLVEEPFAVLARAGGLDEWTLFKQALALSERGMVRFAALVEHAGAELLTAWAVTPERQDQAGEQIAAIDGVAGCVARRPPTTWPHALFATVRGEGLAACQAVAEQIRGALGGAEGRLLPRRRVLERTRLRLRELDGGPRPRTSAQLA
jgi:DNA-binding Lrp family transcriptional regulator